MTSLSDDERRAKQREYTRRYKERNKEKLSQRRKELRALWSEERREHEREHVRRWQEANREYIRAKQLEDYYENKDAYYARNRARRVAVRAGISEPYTATQVIETYGSDCHLCLEPVDLTAPRHASQGEGWQRGLHLDHLVAVAEGGPDILSNVRPSHALCNLRKGSRTPPST